MEKKCHELTSWGVHSECGCTAKFMVTDLTTRTVIYVCGRHVKKYKNTSRYIIENKDK